MKKWQLQSKTVVKNKDQLLEVLLKNRHINKNQVEDFFQIKHPETWQLADLDFSLRNFNKIKKRLDQAKINKERVYIFGDYDSDGICAVAILWEGLRTLGINSLPFIPERQKHGYGLSIKALKDLFAKHGKPDLLITVDNGIVALPALEYLVKQKVSVIVTDHHQANQEKIPALAVFHSTQICGAAVAWFLLKELFKDGGQKNDEQLNDLLSLVAIATVTDLMLLIGVNRSLVSFGLTALKNTQRPGLLALYQLSGLRIEELSTYHLGYVIGPRINAMGRLADSMEALRLLCTNDMARAKKLANLVHDTNLERQDLTKDLIEQAEASLTSTDKKAKILIIDGDYHEGVIGLLAGKLSEKYLKPCIVLAVPKNAQAKDTIIKASARSLAGFNITDFLRQIEDQLLSVGGHRLAAGFSVSLENLAVVKKQLKLLASQQLAGVLLEAQIEVDCQILASLLNLDTALALEAFTPYGNANPQPVFLLKNVLLQNLQSLGTEGKHAKMFFKSQNEKAELTVLAWRYLEKFKQLKIGKHYDLLVSIAANYWRNNTKLQITLLELRESSL